MSSLFVVYATVEGQSAKIAERIAGHAREAGFEAVVIEAKRLSGAPPPVCDRVILVGSVHMGRHARNLEAFVREHRAFLAARPSAFLSVSLSAASTREESRRAAQEMLDAFLASSGWKPDLVIPVAGALPYSKYGFLKRRILRAKSAAEGGPTDTSLDYEYTDWETLRQRVNEFLRRADKEGEARSESYVPREITLHVGGVAASARQSQKRLRDFKEIAELARSFVAHRYGDAGADGLYRDARQHYEEILPQVEWIEGPRGPVLNSFLCATAQALAVYKAVEGRGGTASEAWEICHEAIALKMSRFPKWKRWVLRRFMFSGIVQWIVRRRQRRNERVRIGGFEVRYLTGDGSDFDIGVDYIRCGNLELAKKLGAEAFAPYVCMSDIALSDGLGWGLIRTQTLADGCSHCDFRFKKNGATRISSKTPEVQATIERIERRSE